MNLDSLTSEALTAVNYSDDGTPINISIYLEDLNFAQKTIFHMNPDDIYYHPASLIKLFNSYLASFNLSIDENLDTKSRADIYNAINETLLSSDNDALSLLVDYNTETQSGLRLDSTELNKFIVNRKKTTEFFLSRNYSSGLKLHAKCFTHSPYGRDDQLILEKELGVNSCSIQDIAQIMKDIRNDYPELYHSMKREIGDSADIQTQFIAAGLQEIGSKVVEFYSKAGWNSRVRHDAGLIKFSDGREVLLIIMTKALSEYQDLIAVLSKSIFCYQTT